MRCAVYTRQSVRGRNDLSSCEVQFAACQQWVRSLRCHGFELITERFHDEGYSGATVERPALERLREAVRSGAVDRIVVYRLDRLSRNFRDFAILLAELRSNHVELDIVGAPELGAAASDNLMLSILASFAEFEHDMIAARIADERDYLKSRGRRIAGAVPFGYEADPQTRQLTVRKDDSLTVVRMFEWAQAGLAPTSIAAMGNALGWRTERGQPWTARGVLSVLSNPVYAGWVVHQGALTDACHKPLISRILYQEVQELIRGRRSRQPRTRPLGSAINWLLCGILRCGRCGRLMSGHTIRTGPVVRCYYRCRSTAGGVEPCKRAMVSAYDADNAVLAAIGAPLSLTFPERVSTVTAAVRQAVYDPEARSVKVELIRQPYQADGEAREVDRPEVRGTRTSGPHRR